MAHIRRILVPLDGSPASMAALTEATELAEDTGALVDVLFVRPPEHSAVGSSSATAPPAAATQATQAARETEKAIEDARARLGERLSRRTERGEPLRTILETAKSGYDLVVMGTHGRIGRLHMLLGSVAEGVVRNASCPVLTVRQPDGEEESFSERIHGVPSIGAQGPSR